MRRVLINIFNLKEGEEQRFALLFLVSFVTGLFNALYFARATADFVHYIVKPLGNIYIPIAYIASGVIGYGISSLYTYLQKRWDIRMLYIGITITLITLPTLLRLSVFIADEKWIGFFGYVLSAPMIALATILSGGLALRLLNLQQGKRLLGLINLGSTSASILGYTIGPLLIPYIGHRLNLYLLSSMSPFFALFLLFIIFRRFPLEMQQTLSTKKKVKSDFKTLFKDNYFVYIFISAVFSTLVIYFTSFHYTSIIKLQPEINQSKDQLDLFISYFMGATKVGEFILSYLSGRLLSKYGMKFGLLSLPFSSMLTVAIAALIGLITPTGSLLFFMFIILNRYSERIQRRSIDDPAFRVLYQPIPTEQKMALQTKIDGAVKQISIGITGILLTIITLFLSSEVVIDGKTKSIFDNEKFQFVYLPFLIAWLLINSKLYKLYKQKLKEILTAKSKEKYFSLEKDIYAVDILQQQLERKDISVAFTSAYFLNEIAPFRLHPYFEEILPKFNHQQRVIILQDLAPEYLLFFSEDDKAVLRKLLASIMQNKSSDADAGIVKKMLAQMRLVDKNTYDAKTASPDEQDIRLLKQLLKSGTKEKANEIAFILQSDKTTLKNAVTFLLGAKQNTEFIHLLIEQLKHPKVQYTAIQSLITYGNKALIGLENAFKREKSVTFLLKVIEIYAKIGTPEAKRCIVHQLDYPHRLIRLAAIHALYFSHYQTTEKERPFVKKIMKETVNHILWIYATMIDIEKEKNILKLMQALELELTEAYNVLFHVLSFLHDPTAIDLIKRNLIGDENVFALEIIENFIEDDIKFLINPLFEDISMSQKIKKMRNISPQKQMKFTDRLIDIIHQDYNRTSLWTKTRALELLGRISGNEITNDIVSCMFHNDELLSVSAIKILMQKKPQNMHYYLERAPIAVDNIASFSDKASKYDDNFVLDRLKLLKRNRQLFNIPENILIKLARIFVIKQMRKNGKITLFDDQNPEKIIILITGKLSYHLEEKDYEIQGKEIIIRGLNIPYGVNTLKAEKASLFLLANRTDYFQMYFDNVDLLKHFLDI